MAAFPLPAGHPYASVRPGYAGFETTPAGSVINATASYVGASGDYPTNAITLQLFATQGGTWAVTTPFNLTVQTPAVNNAAYTSIIYTGGLRGSNYTFTSISLTPAQGATLRWTGTAPSVTLTIPGNTTTIASGYYVGGNAGGIYLTPVLDSTLTPIVQGITDYFFVCTTSAAYASVDSIGTAVIPFPTGTTFAAGTTTSLNFTVQCRSNGILGQSSVPFTVGIVQPAVPTLTGVLSGNNVNLTFSSTTPGCTFDLSYSGAVTATGITSPYSYTTTAPGAYTFQVRASLCGLTTFSLPSTTTILPAQPTGVTYTVSGLTISLAWTSPVGTGYTYNVSGTGLAAQPVTVPTAQFTNLQVGSPTFYIQSVYAGILSTTCNVQVSIPTTPPYNFRASAVGSTITLSWANDTPGATFTLSSSSPTTVATQNSLTTPSYTYTNVAGGSYSFTVFSTSAGIPSSPATVAGIVTLTAPTNFAATTLGSTASLTWQEATVGASFNISYVVTSTLSSKAVVAGATTTSISSLPAGNYTFGIQSLVEGASSSFVTAAATIIAAPTSFKATSVGTTISLSWVQATANCSFTVTNPTLGTQTTTNSNVQYTGVAGTSYTFTLTPCNTAAFVGPSVTTTGTVLSTPSPSAVLSGINVNVSWSAVTGTGMTYTVSSSPGVPNPPTQPGTALSVSFVSPPPGAYIFSVIASDSAGNVSVKGTTGSLTVPVPQPINVGATMSASSQITVTWTETLPGCTFTFTGAPATTANSITNTGTTYTGVFNNPPSTTGYTSLAVVAASGGVSSIASTAVSVYTFAPFNLTLSAACSQSGTTNNITAAYSMSSPASIYGAGVNGQITYVANVSYSGTSLTPAITSTTSGLVGNYSSGFYGSANFIINAVPSNFPVNFVVPPSVAGAAVQANGTTLWVRWGDSTTAGCTYTVSGNGNAFISNNIPANSGGTGVYFNNAAIGTAYSFIITASSTGTYTASRYYQPYGGSVVTTENATIPYTITSVSVPSTAVTPINFPATFTAAATGTTIAINWGAVTGATGYTVFNGGSSLFTTTTATSCNYVGSAGTTYTLTVQANGASSSNTNPNTITVIPLLPPTFSSFSQTGSSLAVGCTAPTGSSLSINTPTGLSAPTGTTTFNFTGGSGNTTYSFTVTATGTGATSTATSTFTTLGTPAITSATAQGTATITVNWSYAGPNVSGFTIYSNSVSTATVGPTIRTAIFAQSATTNNADTVYVVANGTIGSSIQSASVSVSDLVTAPTLTSSTVNGLGFTVQWTYSTTAGVRTLSDFQVCNSTQTTLYSTVPYVANQLNYNSLFNVPSIAAYSFVVVGRDSVGSTISSGASTSVTPVAAPTITSVVQTGSTITLAATGSALSTPTVTPALTTVSTGSPWAFTGASGNTLYTFTVQANGTGASNTSSSSITTLATPLAPTLSASGTIITVTWPAAGTYNIYSNTSLVTPATSNTTNATITAGIAAGTTYTYTIALSSGVSTSVPSPAVSIAPVAAPANTLVTQSGANIVVRCDPSTAIFTVTASSSIAGSYTYPLTSFIGSVSLAATIIGGGGGGGAGGNGLDLTSFQLGGGGGGSGGTNTVVCNAVISIAYVVGGAGAGGIESTAPTSGTTGGNSTITLNGESTATATATGGGGGSATGTAGSGGTPGGFSGGAGRTNAAGNPGAGGGGQGGPQGYANAQGGGGGGGGPGGGNGGGGQQPQTTAGIAGNGGSGSQPGAGGGGGGSLRQLGSGGNGGSGAAGRVLVTVSGRQYTPISISTINPTGLTLVSSTLSSFVYSGYTAGTTYTFTVQAAGTGSTNTVTGTVTPLYTPGTPTVTATGATVNITWTYGGSATGITFNVKDANNNWAGTTVTGSLTTSFTGATGSTYSIYVYATSGGNQSANSTSADSITVLGIPTLTQNYQLTTQTKIVGTAAATGAATYSGTADSTLALSAATATGQTLTWTGATGGRAYTGISIAANNGGSTRSITNQTLQSAFDPKSIPGCILWLDGADPNGDSTTPTTITVWKDKSGKANNATIGSGTATVAANGISFDGTSTVFSIPGIVGALVNTPFVVIAIETFNGTFAAKGFYFGDGAGGSAADSAMAIGYRQTGSPSGSGAYTMAFWSDDLNDTNFTTSSPLNVPRLWTNYLPSAANRNIRLNGGVEKTHTNFNRLSSFTTPVIGRGEASGNFYKGVLSEVIVFNTDIKLGTILVLEGYLAWKWGLQTNLVSTNPYSSRYPGTYPLPSAYTGLALWFDAADLTTLFQDKAGTTAVTANGQVVRCWKDKSGNSRDARGGDTIYTVGTGPTYSSNGFNGGYPGLLFGGTSNTILMTAALVPSTALTTGGSNSTIFAVYNRSGTAGNSGVFGLQSTDDTFVLRDPWAFAGSSILDLGGATGATPARVAVTNAVVGPLVMSAYRSGAGTYLYQSTLPLGSNVSSTGTVSATSQGFCIGGGTVLTPVTFSSYISELIIYNTALTDTQRQSIESYLAYKWKC